MVDIHLKLAVLWVALMLTYLLGDVFRIFSGDFKAGEIGGMHLTQIQWLGIAMVMVLPIVMLVLTLLLDDSINRWANIIVAIFFFGFNLIGLPSYPSAYDKFFNCCRLVLECANRLVCVALGLARSEHLNLIAQNMKGKGIIMKAIVCTGYGSPDVLELQEVAKPMPKDNELLIRVHAAVVGPADCAFRKGDPFIVKLMYGLTKPRLATQGVEFAGEIESVGKDVTTFKRGDQVFGMNPDRFGAHAEYMCLPEAKAVVLKPTNTTYAQAVGICDGATTALTFLRDIAKLERGQTVLINGASGAVGAYAVQLAKYFGADVTGVCSTTNVAMVKALGADTVIDYTKTEFTKTGQTYDVIFDAVAKSSFAQCKPALTPTGIYLSTFPGLSLMVQMALTANGNGKKAKFAAAGLMQNKENLNFLKGLVEAGKLKAVIDRRYPLAQTADAHRYVETGRKKGNVIITVGV